MSHIPENRPSDHFHSHFDVVFDGYAETSDPLKTITRSHWRQGASLRNQIPLSAFRKAHNRDTSDSVADFPHLPTRRDDASWLDWCKALLTFRLLSLQKPCRSLVLRKVMRTPLTKGIPYFSLLPTPSSTSSKCARCPLFTVDAADPCGPHAICC